ncbi:NAD(P)-dependent oxidoreductase [Streptomyces scopuliridis]|uniref:NAD(P)-dependent oxidoreductase n=1 Tax=Streptomyces scopuliridis TaxID=452529 RepID=UPI0036A14238
MTIGFVGLGIMGLPMAAALLDAGHQVIGYNRSAARTDELVRRGGGTADSLAELGRRCDMVITMLPDTPDVEAVALTPEGLLTTMRPGSLLIDMSTVHPDTARRIAAAGRDRGVDTLDAPVSGGEQGAIDRVLSIMVGGEAAALDRALPYLRAMGRTVVHVGPAGAGQTVKAANQLIVAGNLAILAEALVLLDVAGLPLPTALEVLGDGLAGSRVLSQKGATMSDGAFTPGFRVALHHKDLGIALETARGHGVALPVGSVAAQEMASLVAMGAGALDHAAVISLVRLLSGVDAGQR